LGCGNRDGNGFDEEGGRGRNLEGRGTGDKITNGIIVRKKEIICPMICEGLCVICNTVHQRVGRRVLAASTQQLLVNIMKRLEVFILCLRANHSATFVIVGGVVTERNVCLSFIVG